MKFYSKIFYCLGFFSVIFSGCARAPLKDSSEAVLPYEEKMTLVDDLGYESLRIALKNLVETWEEKDRSDISLRFGPRIIPAEYYFAALQELLTELHLDQSGRRFIRSLEDKFDLYIAYGRDEPGDVLVTSYYDPIIPSSAYQTRRFSQPVYRKPKDLVTIRLDRYKETFPDVNWLKDLGVTEQKTKESVLRGRILKRNGTDRPARVVPYFSRHEIDVDGKLRRQGLEIAYVDPVDSFILQIQGAGILRLPSGQEISVGYAGQNGHRYVALGSVLKDEIPEDAMSMQAIEHYLRKLPLPAAQEIMDKNPSYVFFKQLQGSSEATFGTNLVAGRTIATDRSLFPKGTLAFVEFQEPQFARAPSGAIDTDEYGRPEVYSWVRKARFVVDADTGGAIRGPAHLDLYWGKGKQAERVGGVMNQRGRLFYFVPKPSYIEALARYYRLKKN